MSPSLSDRHFENDQGSTDEPRRCTSDRERRGPVADVINQHVSRLAMYQPFDTQFAQLYAEYVDTQKSNELSTSALGFVASVVDEPLTRMIVLTGDAGHGKTHLCGQLIARHAGTDIVIRTVLAENCTGKTPVANLPSGRPLRVIKDLSEMTPEEALERLGDCYSAIGSVTVVCANEGRLRQVLALRSARLEDQAAVVAIGESLNSVLQTGSTTTDGSVHVVDLNHQSVAAPGGKSLVQQIFRNWVDDQRKWSTCDQCPDRERCPIFENRKLLVDPVRSPSRRAGFETLLRVAEQTGHVVTIRELLVFAAHALTGGLRCEDVHRKAQRSSKDTWQANHLFHQAAFGDLLKEGDRNRLRVFRAMRLLDPGARALRPVDDALVGEEDLAGARFVPPGFVESRPVPKNHAQRQKDSEFERTRFRYLRRVSYFDADESANGHASSVTFAERLGLRHYDHFEGLFASGLPPAQRIRQRDLVLRGLEAVQGVRGHSGAGAFVIVDPAFSTSRSGASVVSVKLPVATVELLSQTQWWTKQGHSPNLAQAVDWVDRRVFVVLRGAHTTRTTTVALDCRQFEFVCRASKGLSSSAFFQADIRRMMAQLAEATENAPQDFTITVLVDGRPANLVIDVGDIIEVTVG